MRQAVDAPVALWSAWPEKILDVPPARGSGPLTPLDQRPQLGAITPAHRDRRCRRNGASREIESGGGALIDDRAPRVAGVDLGASAHRHLRAARRLDHLLQESHRRRKLGNKPSTTAPEASCVCSSRVSSLPGSLGGQSRIDKRAKVLHNYTCRATNKDLGQPGWRWERCRTMREYAEIHKARAV